MVSLLSQKPRKRNISQGYGVLAFPEALKKYQSYGYGVVALPISTSEKCWLGLYYPDSTLKEAAEEIC